MLGGSAIGERRERVGSGCAWYVRADHDRSRERAASRASYGLGGNDSSTPRVAKWARCYPIVILALTAEHLADHGAATQGLGIFGAGTASIIGAFVTANRLRSRD
jgi:hypothetical protein